MNFLLANFTHRDMFILITGDEEAQADLPINQTSRAGERGDGMMAAIKIPKRFFEDHAERDLPTPTVLRETKSYLVIDTNDDAFAELIDDAKHYANEGVDFGPISAAKALLAAVHRQSH